MTLLWSNSSSGIASRVVGLAGTESRPASEFGPILPLLWPLPFPWWEIGLNVSRSLCDLFTGFEE
jgi:hypothetical protein